MNWFGQECLKGLRVGTQSAEVALFEQFQGDSEFLGEIGGKRLVQ